MNEMKFENRYRYAIILLSMIFIIISIFSVFVISHATYLGIIFLVITLSGCLYWVITGGMRYAIIINNEKIKIFSKTYLLSQVKLVELIPWTAALKIKKDGILYGYIIFYIEKQFKIKKIRIYGGCIKNHKNFVEALRKYGIKHKVIKI